MDAHSEPRITNPLERSAPWSTAHKIAWSTLFAAWAAALALAAPLDLPLAQAIVRSGDPFAGWIQSWGTTPSGVLYVAVVAVLMVPSLRRRSELLQIACVTLLCMSLLHPLLITTAIKLLWGRARYLSIVEGKGIFTPFYLPAGPGSGVSFPSGHVASAFVCSPLVLLLWQERKRISAVALGALVLAWGVTVAYGRLLLGAHFLTDVLFSAGLSVLLAPHVVTLGRRVWARWFREAEKTERVVTTQT